MAPFTKAEYKAVRRTAKNMGITLVKQYIEGKPVYLPREMARKLELPPEQIAALIGADKLVCPFLGRGGKNLLPDIQPPAGSVPLVRNPPGTEPAFAMPESGVAQEFGGLGGFRDDRQR
jgi:hypothetical protein